MSQTRVVLDEKYLPLAKEIIEQTGINTYSQLFSILLVNYGDTLVKSLRGSHE
ncbi:hypothetical protein NIES37_73470 (plasmid) [Tolypothrix tenuis PCC 7101]|jgi:hypothetical protein|uniref:Uncharacterized protein n=1 Tax=Tolypothrix tenuis PCC 7101 TaxID=231146 RepID=A0A1Z4NC93_9CYAN|nr:hypothetical protein [Tolypothrix sp. PCC 7910]MBD2169087.1 hypothetical protein [Calothrix membranacea FACHB-236]MBD2240795.1 hypothetical protein [Aulosira sp. FACHB-113]BAZ03334.1 hypothetical protein NIES37_73470 [Tolypothrix tenuis PCC 7101]BAZ78695.1 hypothetical protein NIES50_73280 [Aulosira laxa NIES-50]QIR41812.1 hypothetical protein HCG51_34555 [Tolypothrix sp. PCC 7910]